MDGNFKVRCIDNYLNPGCYTTGKVYEFYNGQTVDDTGVIMPMQRIRNFEEWRAWSSSEWELVDENDNGKVGGFIHCKICKRRFELKKPFRYVAVKTESIFPLKSVLYDAFDCPHCGCQNIVGIRESEVKSNE